MKFSDIAHQRLYNQGISNPRFKKVRDVVAWFGAMQAQDYPSALWAIALRMSTAVTPAEIEEAISKREIVRMWPMRGTLHFVAAEDAHWIHQLLMPRLTNAYNSRSERLGITPAMLKKSGEVFTKSLRGDKQISRPELYEILEKAGIKTTNSIGLHIIGRLAHEGLICFGPRKGKQPTFALFDEWVPASTDEPKTRDEALARLSLIYFRSHGPATIQDFNWWSGLTTKDIRRGIEMNTSKLVSEVIEGKTYYMAAQVNLPKLAPATYLLPSFDEYIVAYRDRNAVLEEIHKEKINPGANGMLSATVVIDGQVLGNWKRTIKNNTTTVTATPFTKFSKSDHELMKSAIGAYQTFANASLTE